MAAYLIDHPPVRDQFYKTRNRPLTGCTVLHTAEGVLDTIGPDTGAEATADFIRRRTTPGSYHDIADSDSCINVVPYESGAYHDGTGSNNWALSISFACGTHHWRQMTPERRRGFLQQGARAFVAQQAWRKANGYPLTELRYITKAQSDAGESGFIEHGRRDPARRTDPGVNPPDLFPYDEWLTECQAALDGTALQEDDMYDQAARDEVIGRIDQGFASMVNYFNGLHNDDTRTRIGLLQYGIDLLLSHLDTEQLDYGKLAAALAPVIAPMVDKAGSGATAQEIVDLLADRLKPTA